MKNGAGRPFSPDCGTVSSPYRPNQPSPSVNETIPVRSLLIVATGMMWAAAGGALGGEVDAKEIIRRSDDLLRRGQSYARFTMKIERPDWTRSVEMESWTKGVSNAFMRVLAPKKEKDVTFLKKGREAWQFVPSVDRVIKIPPSMMLQSWMGSDFTNDDIVRADSLVVDYTHRITGEPAEEGVSYWIIEAIPLEEAPVVWGKVEFKVRQENYVADRVDYYDEEGILIKYYLTFAIKEVEGLSVATAFTMFDLTREGYKTSLTYEDITFKPDIKPSTFSVRSLRR
jgi:outer membrane lipoprotein-sorting protein